MGLLDKKLAGRELIQEAEAYCPHHVSHYLGMDVHDTKTVPRNVEVPAGVCMTVEPGIYIFGDNDSVPAEFRGIGMRIEDDVLITETGADVLTENCPWEPSNLLANIAE